jgi:putative membrane protein
MQPSRDDSMPRQDADSRDPTTYLAEDRTLLAWIRSGIALMGFGFVVARFDHFLHELDATQSGSPGETTAFSVVLGTVLMVRGGVLVTILASFKYMRRIRDLEQGVRTMGKTSEFGAVRSYSAIHCRLGYYWDPKGGDPLPKSSR